MTYLLNRFAQRYLIRDGSSVLSVGAPDQQLHETAAWRLSKGRPGNTLHLVATDGSTLAVSDDVLVLGNAKPGRRRLGAWRLTPVRDRSSYQYIESVSRPGWGLRITSKEPDDSGRYGVTVGPVEAGDPSGMWLVSDSCVADARSIHLRYGTDGEVDAFYNEVTPYDTPPGTYLCAIGFSPDPGGRGPGGYAGIQERPDGSRIAIFSIWHRMLGAEVADRSAPAVPVTAHSDAEQTAFSGEGSGVSVRIPFDWPNDGSTPVRFVVRADAEGDDTTVTTHIAVGNKPWIHLGTIRREETGGRLLSNLYSFVEDFQRNGNTEGVAARERSPYRMRRARFENPWVDRNGLESVRSVNVTAYPPHPLENLSVTLAEHSSFGLVVATGGGGLVLPPVVGTTIADTTWRTRHSPDISGSGSRNE